MVTFLMVAVELVYLPINDVLPVPIQQVAIIDDNVWLLGAWSIVSMDPRAGAYVNGLCFEHTEYERFMDRNLLLQHLVPGGVVTDRRYFTSPDSAKSAADICRG